MKYDQKPVKITSANIFQKTQNLNYFYYLCLMKVIFLDIDGVLATDSEFMMNRTKFRTKYPEANELRIPYPFNSDCVKIFNEILEQTDAKIVLSSDWRLHWNLEELDLIFKFNNVNKSPEAVTLSFKRKMSSDMEDDRSWQIKEYVDYNKIANWVAIDDLNLSSLGSNFVRTKDSEGLKQLGLKNKIISILEGIK